MSKGYRHIQQYEKEILELKQQGYTRKQIGDVFGFTAEQIHEFTKRYNRKQKRIETGIALKRKGRPPKDYVVTEESKIAEIRYILARKDAKIKSLEMENELMRDFLSLTGRK